MATVSGSLKQVKLGGITLASIVFRGRTRVKSRMNNHVTTSVDSTAKPVEQLSLSELVEATLLERGWLPASSQARAFKSHFKSWWEYLGLSDASLASAAVSPGALGLLSNFTDRLASADKAGKVRNIRWAVAMAHRIYERLRSSSALPTDFQGAFNAALKAKGWTVYDLARAIRAQFHAPGSTWQATGLLAWASGQASPSNKVKKSAVIVRQAETCLDLPEGVLSSRAFKGPRLIQVGNPGENAYREHQSRRTKSVYAMSEMPAQLAGLWREVASWRSQKVLRVKGEVHLPKNIWQKSASADKYRMNLLRFFGWLCLPASTKPSFELTEEERWLSGKGMKSEDITFAQWFDTELLWEFFEFLRGRQHNGVFTAEHQHFAVFINSLVNHPYAFVKAHDKLAPLFGQTLKGEDWVAYVEEKLHKPVLKLCSQLTSAMSPDRQRNPDEALKTVFRDADPMLLLMELVRRMKESLSPASHRHTWAAELRDIALFSMCLEVPLRARNLSELRVGTQLIRNPKTGIWALSIPKTDLKNHHSPHAHDIDREYTAATSLDMDRYFEQGRPVLRGADTTDWFFLTGSSGPKRILKEGDSPFQLVENSIYWAVRGRTEKYFGKGSGSGSNLFRHLLATSILKSDPSQIETASAVLNNSPDTVRENYKHLTQKDGLRTAASWQEAQQAKFQQRFGSASGDKKS